MKDETNHIFYKQFWVDRGGNVGVECDKCGNTIWGKHSLPRLVEIPRDPTIPNGDKIKVPCPNDQALIQSNLWKLETERHTREVEAYERKLALAKTDEERSQVVFECSHRASQPPH
jgi:hypothetical protein